MATAKYKQYVEKMLTENKEIFDEFKDIHTKYDKNEEKYQEVFNEKGKVVVELMREYEAKLCYGSERGGYSAYTSNLAQKFQDEVRREFPLIDFVGVKVKKSVKDTFNLKKIDLN